MATTGHGDILTPDDSTGFDVPVVMRDMALSLEPRVLDQYASKSARNTATSALTTAGKRVVCWVDGNVGLCGHDGSAWVNLSPPKRYGFDHGYGTGAVANPSSTYTDPSPLVITNVVNGQTIDLEIQASIRVDGSTRQSILIGATATNALQTTQALVPTIVSLTAAGTENEYATYTRKMGFYCDTGTVSISLTIACGSGSPRIVMNQAQMWATLYPASAA